MGGQACILYGAAEFSRDLDLSISIEEQDEKMKDKKYWKPLQEELERWRKFLRKDKQ